MYNQENVINNFFQNSKVQRTPENVRVMEIMLEPMNLVKMAAFIEAKMPALCGCVKAIDDEFSGTEYLNDFRNKQNIGRMLKYVLRQFGYIPVESGLGERCRIPISISSNFNTSALYESGAVAKYQLKASIDDVNL